MELDPLREENIIHTQRLSRTDEPDVWKLATAWIEQCTTEHTACLVNADGNSQPWYPTRLIDVGGSRERHGEDKVYLHDTKKVAVKGHYVSLSHCWGGKVPLMLTTDNEQEFVKGIAFRDLPRSFAEAVKVARHLGIRYM